MPSSAQSLGSWATTDPKKNHLLITNRVYARSQTWLGAGGVISTPPVAVGAQEDGVSTESRPRKMEDERAGGGIMGWVAHDLRFNFFQLWLRILSSSFPTRIQLAATFLIFTSSPVWAMSKYSVPRFELFMFQFLAGDIYLVYRHLSCSQEANTCCPSTAFLLLF